MALSEAVNVDTLPTGDRVEITDSDKVNFTLSFLRSQPFRKSYPILGGKATITFQSVPFEVARLISSAAGQDFDLLKGADFNTKLHWLTLAASVESIVPEEELKSEVSPIVLGPLDDVENEEDLISRLENLVERLSNSFAFDIVSRKCDEFLTLVNELCRRASSENF